MEKNIFYKLTQNNTAYFALAVAIASTLGSLYFSNVLGFPPCVLCWYQRILMYPLIAIIMMGIVRKDRGLPLYVLPLSVLGLAFSAYHNVLYYTAGSTGSTACAFGISCTTKFIEWFGFVTIPLLSFIGFSLITISMIVYWKINIKKYENNNHY